MVGYCVDTVKPLEAPWRTILCFPPPFEHHLPHAAAKSWLLNSAAAHIRYLYEKVQPNSLSESHLAVLCGAFLVDKAELLGYQEWLDTVRRQLKEGKIPRETLEYWAYCVEDAIPELYTDIIYAAQKLKQP